MECLLSVSGEPKKDKFGYFSDATVGVFHGNPSDYDIGCNVPPRQQHVLAVLRVLVRSYVSVNRLDPVSVSEYDGAVHLLPHCRAVSHVILPVDVEPCILARHNLLVGQGLGAVGVEEPFQVIGFVEFARQFCIVTLSWEPAKGYDVEVAAVFPGFLRRVAAGLYHNLWAPLVMCVAHDRPANGVFDNPSESEKYSDNRC